MSEPVYFLKLGLWNYRFFTNYQVLDLSDGKGNWKKWTVVLGDNGTGKSSLIALLAGCEMKESKAGNFKIYSPRGLFSSGDPFPAVNIDDEYNGECQIGLNIFWNPEESAEMNDFSEVVKFAFYRNLFFDFTKHTDSRLKGLKCFGYGANRKMGLSSLSNLMESNSETIFNDEANLINAEEWLLQLDYAASKDSPVQMFAIEKRDQVKQILIDLLPDIEDIRFTEPTKESLKSTVEFQTPFGWVSIQQLSLGYKTMVTWMVDLAARMFERYPDSQNPLAEPAIVLVDEIDLHLHPKWQRKIFDYLSEKFPQTQFIVTAHSPLIVQSAPKDANIVLLRKDGDQVVIDNDFKSVQNWRIDQILTSDLFGLESARGTETEKKLEERKQLLAKDKLTKEEKTRLNELNSFANRLPVAYTYNDIEAMNIVQEAAEYLKKQKE